MIDTRSPDNGTDIVIVTDGIVDVLQYENADTFSSNIPVCALVKSARCY